MKLLITISVFIVIGGVMMVSAPHGDASTEYNIAYKNSMQSNHHADNAAALKRETIR